MTRPLEGVRVLDLGQVIAIPFCTQWMAWMGADVVLVESAQHFTSRVTPPFAGGTPHPDASGSFNLLNGGKRSITVNLREERGRQIILDLAKHSDIVVDNFGPGVLERFRLQYDDMRETNPEIIMLSLGAFGRSGPMGDMPGYHSAVNLFSGVADVTGYQDGHPRIMGGVIPDPFSGAYALFALLTSLRHRRRTGKGRYIDGAMYEGLLTLIPQAVIDHTLNEVTPTRVGNRDWNGLVAPQGVYRCDGDDAWVALEVHTGEQWRALCDVIGADDWASDERFEDVATRIEQHDEIDARITEWARGRSPHDAAETLQAAGVPAGPVLRPDQLVQDPVLREQGFIVTTEHPVGGVREHPGVPWAGDINQDVVFRPAPLLGAHTREVLRDLLGYDDQTIDTLAEDGVLT